MLACVNVDLALHPYPVYIGQQIYADPVLLQNHITGHQVLVVTQENIAHHHLAPLLSALTQWACDVVYLPEGEQHKTLVVWQQIMDHLVQKGHERSTTLIALGGGVVGDMTGFAAACYQRGVSYLQIPTTLIAQVDAAIGGKTAVNHALAKNMIGAFHQPECVISDIDLLRTLPEREYFAGLAEVIKYALIEDAEFFVWLEQHVAAILAKEKTAVLYLVTRCTQIKASFVIADEKEQGRRSLLNFGHTFGHALEAAAAYHDLLHGEAVGIGMLLASELSCAFYGLPLADLERIQQLLSQFGLADQAYPLPPVDDFIALMQRDKKRLAGDNQFILLKRIGLAEKVGRVPEAILRQLLTR